jgi:hypothetical protein
MLTIFLILLAVIAVLLTVCIVRAVQLKPTEAVNAKIELHNGPEDRRYGESLSRMVQCETISKRGEYDEEKFPKFDNADIISVKSQRAIPDTDEVLGVPVSILQNVDPDNLPFEILGVDGKLRLNGETVFDRLIIKLK